MRKILSITLALIMLFSFSVTSMAASDISGHWAEKIISKWIEAEKISGYPDGTFKPNNNITRAEFSKIIASILPNHIAEYEEMKFEDVSEDDWYYESVRKLLTLGVVASDVKFNPNNNLSRQDAMTMIGRAFGYSSEEAVLDTFSDKDEISDYAKEFVAALVESGVVGGYEDKTIRPLANITRAECLKILDGFNVVKDPDSLEGIMERIYAGVDAQYPMLMNMEITPETSEYYLGIPEMEFEEAIASESMMMAQAHSVCLVRVKEGSDIEAIKEEIRTKVDPRKWICVGVERDEVIVTNQDNLILLIIDQFDPEALRDSFLSLDLKKKQLIEANADGLIYNNGFYMDFIGETRENGVNNFADKINYLATKYSVNNNVYYSVIPSKSYYINNELKTPFNYDKMFGILNNKITNAKYIDITGALTLEDYYITDPHWKQENLKEVVDILGKNMGFEVDFNTFTENTVENFIGQHGYNKENFTSENLVYLTNTYTDSTVATHIESGKTLGVYDLEKLNSDSPYDMFLSGPSAIVTLKNEQAKTDKELIILRDSYSCSLAPLLTEVYKEITLVDLRYVMSPLLDMYVKFENKDILFLYNEQIINNGEMLKVVMS